MISWTAEGCKQDVCFFKLYFLLENTRINLESRTEIPKPLKPHILIPLLLNPPSLCFIAFSIKIWNGWRPDKVWSQWQYLTALLSEGWPRPSGTSLPKKKRTSDVLPSSRLNVLPNWNGERDVYKFGREGIKFWASLTPALCRHALSIYTVCATESYGYMAAFWRGLSSFSPRNTADSYRSHAAAASYPTVQIWQTFERLLTLSLKKFNEFMSRLPWRCLAPRFYEDDKSMTPCFN